MAAPTRKSVAAFLIGVSLIVGGMGAASVVRMLRAERETRAVNPIPTRGAPTTLAGLTIAVGIAGVLAGCGLPLMPEKKPPRG